MSFEKESNIDETEVRSIRSYTTYEFGIEVKNYGKVIFLANVRKEDNKDLLEISIKTRENAGMTHFAVGMFIDDVNEVAIKNEIERIIECNYFDDNISLAFKDEEKLEQFHNDMLTREEGK